MGSASVWAHLEVLLEDSHSQLLEFGEQRSRNEWRAAAQVSEESLTVSKLLMLRTGGL